MTFDDSFCFFSMSRQSGKFTYFCFTRTYVINSRKEKDWSYQLPHKPPPKISTLLGFVAASVYLNKKITFIVQLSYLTSAKPESGTSHLIKGSCSALLLRYTGVNFYKKFILLKYERSHINDKGGKNKNN